MTHRIVNNFLQLTGVTNCVTWNWVLGAQATNSALGDLSIGAEQAILAYQLVEFWFKAVKDGRFTQLLADMEQSGSIDFSNVEVNDYALPYLARETLFGYINTMLEVWIQVIYNSERREFEVWLLLR